MCTGQFGLDLPGRLNEGAAIIVMLGNARRNGKDVGVENDVFRRDTRLAGQEVIGALADVELALRRFGLTVRVKRHDNDGSAIA